MSNIYEFGWPSSLAAIHFPAQGYAVLELTAELGSVNDQGFIDNFGFTLGSNYPLIKGNMLASAGPIFDNPAVTKTNLPWFHKTLKKQVLDLVSSGDFTVIDKGLYDVMTDKGEITDYSHVGPGGSSVHEIPYIIDFTTDTGNAAVDPQIRGGIASIPFPPPPDRLLSEADVFINITLPTLLPGFTTFAHHLKSVISSHVVSGGTITDYDRKFAAIYIFDLSKIKAAVGNLWRLTIDCSGQDDTGFARQTAVWTAQLSLWKKQKVFPQAPSGVLALPMFLADDFSDISGPAPNETVIKSKHAQFEVSILDHKILSSSLTDN